MAKKDKGLILDSMFYKNFKVGDRVSVKQEETSYDRLGPILPSDVGTIKAFAPKVRMCKGPLQDGLPYFAYIEFDRTVTIGRHTCHLRSGIDICNIRKVSYVKPPLYNYVGPDPMLRA